MFLINQVKLPTLVLKENCLLNSFPELVTVQTSYFEIEELGRDDSLKESALTFQCESPHHQEENSFFINVYAVSAICLAMTK